MFYSEETGYTKTSLFDLQGAWEVFKESILTLHPFLNSDRIIFHTYEAMSWESVRDLKRMRSLYLLIRNIVVKTKQKEILLEHLENIKMCLDEAAEEYGN